MDVSTFLFFIACLLFAGVNMIINMNVRFTKWLKLLTLLLALGGLGMAGYLLIYVLFK